MYGTPLDNEHWGNTDNSCEYIMEIQHCSLVVGGGMKQQQQKRAGGVALAAAAHHRWPHYLQHVTYITRVLLNGHISHWSSSQSSSGGRVKACSDIEHILRHICNLLYSTKITTLLWAAAAAILSRPVLQHQWPYKLYPRTRMWWLAQDQNRARDSSETSFMDK